MSGRSFFREFWENRMYFIQKLGRKYDFFHKKNMVNLCSCGFKEESAGLRYPVSRPIGQETDYEADALKIQLITT